MYLNINKTKIDFETFLFFKWTRIRWGVKTCLIISIESFSGEDPMLLFHQYYDQANYNYDSFIQIR